MSIATLSTRAQVWKQPERPLPDERIKETTFRVHEVEYHSALGKKEVLKHVNMGEPRGHEPSEISQSQKDNYSMIPCTPSI